MAKFETSAGLNKLTGKLDKRSCLTMRQKTHHYPDGSIFGYGPKEVYAQRKRNYKRHPRTLAEQAQYEKWKSICREASVIIKDPNHPRYSEMVARHAAQFNGNPEPLIGKVICQFGNFVRSVLIHELSSE